MNFLEVTHSVTKHKALLIPTKILGVSYSEDLSQTFIIADAGSIFPISETKDYVLRELARMLDLNEPKIYGPTQRPGTANTIQKYRSKENE